MGGPPGRPDPLCWGGAEVQEVRLRKEQQAGLPRQANLRSQLPVATNSGSGCTPTTQAALFPGAGLGCPAPSQSAVGNRASASLLGRGPAGGGVETWPVPLCALVPPLF